MKGWLGGTYQDAYLLEAFNQVGAVLNYLQVSVFQEIFELISREFIIGHFDL